MAQHVERHAPAELVHELRQLRARAHQAHIAPEDVEELGELVDGVAAHKGAEGRAARVARHRPAVGLAVVQAHGAELVHVEALAIAPHALLLEDDGAGRGKLCADDRHEHDGRGEHDEDGRAQHVHRALDEGEAQVVEHHAVHVDEGHAALHAHRGAAREELPVGRQDGELDAAALAGDEDGVELVLLAAVDGDHHLVGEAAVEHGVDVVVVAQQVYLGGHLRRAYAAQHHLARLGVARDALNEGGGPRARPHHHDAAQVAAHAVGLTQHARGGEHLAARERDRDEPVEDRHPAGEVHHAQHEHEVDEEHRGDGVGRHHLTELAGDVGGAVVVVHAEQPVEEQVHGREGRDPQHVLAQAAHRVLAREQVEAQPEGNRHREGRNEDVHEVRRGVEGALPRPDRPDRHVCDPSPLGLRPSPC